MTRLIRTLIVGVLCVAQAAVLAQRARDAVVDDGRRARGGHG